MIFSFNNHIELIKKGQKTQTRRASDRYQVGKSYSIQPRRTAKGISEGIIFILKKEMEICWELISIKDAKAEGNYTPEDFENLYEKKYPKWVKRYVYIFRYLPTIKTKEKKE